MNVSESTAEYDAGLSVFTLPFSRIPYPIPPIAEENPEVASDNFPKPYLEYGVETPFCALVLPASRLSIKMQLNVPLIFIQNSV